MVNPAKSDRSSARVVESLQERKDRALATARRPAKSVSLAGADSKTDILQSGMIWPLRIAHLDVVPVMRSG